jgi:hypothetical protein
MEVWTVVNVTINSSQTYTVNIIMLNHITTAKKEIRTEHTKQSVNEQIECKIYNNKFYPQLSCRQR